MTQDTRHTILKKSKQLFAVNGYEGFSIRTLAKESGIGISSIYHFFSDKDEILKDIFDTTSKELGVQRALLPESDSASEMLMSRVVFQFNHIEDVVYLLKYYLHFRPNYLKLESGYIPNKGYLHVEEVLRFGVDSGEFYIEQSEIEKQAKVIAHAINGFLLEYYPETPKGSELVDVTKSIHSFLIRSLTNKEVAMK